MKLDPNLYNLVFELATAMTNASEREATEEYWQHYQTLERECEAARRNDNVHPFLWETLADYTADNREALFIYKKGLALAETYELSEYSASISLAMAERFDSLGKHNSAREYAFKALDKSEALEDPELKQEISKFLVKVGDAT